MDTMTTLRRLGDLQISALEIYITDPVAADGEDFPATVDYVARTLAYRSEDKERVWVRLRDAANAIGDDDGDRELSDALHRLASRVLRA